MVRREKRRALEAGQAFFQGDVARLHFIAPAQIQHAWINHDSLGRAFPQRGRKKAEPGDSDAEDYPQGWAEAVAKALSQPACQPAD